MSRKSKIKRLERKVDCRFGDPDRPLLLSVRSSGAISMPGVTCRERHRRAPTAAMVRTSSTSRG